MGKRKKLEIKFKIEFRCIYVSYFEKVSEKKCYLIIYNLNRISFIFFIRKRIFFNRFSI